MALKNLRNEFRYAIAGGESAIRINTDEQEDAIRTLVEVCEQFGWELRVWDHATGVVWYVGEEPESRKAKKANPQGGPAGLSMPGVTTMLGALVELWDELPQYDKKGGGTRPIITVFRNFHLAFDHNRGQVVSTIQHLAADLVQDHPQYEKLKGTMAQYKIDPESDTGKFVVGLMPEEGLLPPELKPIFKVLTHELPDEAELGHILDGVSVKNPVAEADKKKICQFALGLTRLQAEGVFGSCSVAHKTVIPDFVWKEKSEILNKEGLVALHQGKETFKNVAGLTGAKEFLTKLLAVDEFDDADPECRARGVLFVGPPGTGKSLIAKATGNELGLPTLVVHPGNWMGSLVGETEAKTRKGFQIIRAHAPCVCILDEIEKVMPSSRGGDHDGGVGARMEGTFLTQLNDIEERVMWCFTANDVERMHEAFFRAERVDATFYVGLPNQEARAAIWRLYITRFFPSHINGKPYPRYMELNVNTLLAEYRKIKKIDEAVWADKFAAALMCMTNDKRDALLEQISDNEPNGGDLVERITNRLIDDNGWTPAEIKSCCRLSRRLNEPLSQTKRRIRPVSVTAAKVIRRLEKWAADSALDAETGEIYEQSPETTALVESHTATKKKSSGKVRRKVRSLAETSEPVVEDDE